MLKKFLFSIDLYGIEYSFRENSDTKYHTIQGSLLSLLSYTAIIVVSILFGKEIFVNRIPYVNSGEKLIPFQESEVNLSYFPIAFLFQNGSDLSTMDPRNYYSVKYMVFTNDENNVYTNTPPLPLDFVKCNFDDIEKRYNVEGSIQDKDNYCLNFNNITIYNDGSDRNSRNVVINLSKCDIKTNPNCKDPFEYSETMNLWISSINHIIDAENYLNPLTFRSTSVVSRMSLKALVANRFNFKVNKIETDVGKVFDDIKSDKYITTDPIEQSLVLNSSNAGLTSPILFRMFLNSNTLSNVMTRRYMKAQELLSRIGGITNAIVILGYIIIYNFNYFSFVNETNMELSKFKDDMIIKENLKSYENLNHNRVDSNHNLNHNMDKSSQILNNISQFKINNLFERENQNLEKKQPENDQNLKSNNYNLKLNEENLKTNSSGDYITIDKFNSFLKDLQPTIKSMIDTNSSFLIQQRKEVLYKNCQSLLENQEDSVDDYFSYIFAFIFCCKSSNLKRKKVFEDILSFNSLVKTTLSSKVLQTTISESS